MSIKMSISPGVPSSSQSPLSSPPPVSPPPTTLPLRTIPGSYGLPLLGPISDRLDYFWFQGPETFLKKRIEKHRSTVFRTNIPPTFPFFSNVNPNVVAVLDTKSFAHLFDMDLVDKRDVLVGDFMPSVKFTGDIRVCAYLDTSEPQHSKLPCPSPTVHLQVPRQVPCWADPSSSQEIAESGYAMLDRWLALQLLPTIYIGALQPLVEIFLHSWAYPFFLVSGDYKKIYEFVEKEGKEVLQRGETEFGLTRKESIHNLLFVLGFNAFGGFSVFLPSLVSAIVTDTTGLQAKLIKEAREKGGSTLSFDSIKEMPLIQSAVYETLRLNPPVPIQYGRARKDFQLSSHDSVYDIKKGELLCGYQKLVMKDPKIFDEPESFKPDRFMNEKGSELLNYLYWSNGPQTGSPTASNKQCAAKDYVVLTAALFVAYVFRRYDSITGDSSSITAVEKAK
ncbi:fatty acid hydroperoxide lyase [Quercus suber]|uniref:Fatty acid hydroperoxide lyase n=1 Tax=Quercus suber TaxID=58331 RepID=A0AAW0KLF1_QUESU